MIGNDKTRFSPKFRKNSDKIIGDFCIKKSFINFKVEALVETHKNQPKSFRYGSMRMCDPSGTFEPSSKFYTFFAILGLSPLAEFTESEVKSHDSDVFGCYWEKIDFRY
jgi:hypothetical protein